MNSKKIVASIIVIILLVLGVFWYLKGPKETPQNSQNNAILQENSTNKQQVTASLKDLLVRKDNQKCSYTDRTDGSQSSGTIYSNAKQMRGDFSYTDAQGKTMTSHMVSDAEFVHVWVDGQPRGFKMSVATADSPTSGDATQNAGFDLEKSYSYDCDSWNVDSSLFKLPTGVEFTDISKMTGALNGLQTVPAINSGNTPPTGQVQNLSAVCDQLPEPSKSECLTALKK